MAQTHNGREGLSRLWVDMRWALDAAARGPELRRAMTRAAYAQGAALAVVVALLVHRVLVKFG